MEEINHSFNWGGYRPGAGQKPKWNSGATATVRVPEKLIPDVLWYARLIDGQFPNGLQASDCLSCNIDSVTLSSDLSGRLEEVVQERDRLDKECHELAGEVGVLQLQLEELKQRDDSVTLSSLVQALQEILDKNESDQRGYKDNGFSRGLKKLQNLVESVT